MKNIFIFSAEIFSILFFYSCSSKQKEIVERWPNSKPKTEIRFINKADSTYTRFEYYISGQLKSRQDFVKAKLNGKVVNYSEKGYKSQEFDYVDGKKNGIGTAWYESGKIAFQFKYKNGDYFDGTEYYEDGWPRVLVKFSAPGIREGKAIYFTESGKVRMEGFFKNDKQDSIWVKYDESGNVLSRTYYRDGLIVNAGDGTTDSKNQ